MKLKISISLFLISISIFAQTVKVKIIETSDVHGAIFPYNFSSEKEVGNSLANVTTYVKQQRKDTSQTVILIDNGDILQGDPSVYYYNFERIDEKHLLARVMNFMQYDVGTVGNHDIEPGHNVYDKFNNELNFPWLAANAINTNNGETYFQPYQIFKVPSKNKIDSIKIAVLGLITPGIPNWLPENIWSGIEFEDMILTAKKWVEIIEKKENPDLLLGVFHAGVDYTYDNQTAESFRNENASQLVAEQVPGFDIVFVGHDHHEWNFKVADPNGDSVLILGPTSKARSITEADIEFSKKGKILEKRIIGNVNGLNDIKPDHEFLEKFNPEFEEIKNYISRKIGTLNKSISAEESLFGNSLFVDLIHKVQLEISGAEISFTAPLSLHAKIDSGNIYVKDMFDLYKYENLLYTMELTGKEIKDYLEYSYAAWFNTIKDINDNLLLFAKDENGNLIKSKRSNSAMLKNRYYNFDSAEGIDYVVNVTKPQGERIKIKSLSNSKPFALNKKYKVAINSYRGNGGGGHLVEGAGIPKEELSKRVIESTEKDLRYYMLKWFEEQKEIDIKETNNWKVVPEELVEKIKPVDEKLLFN